MTLPARGARRIEVDGVGYLWRVRRKPTKAQARETAPMRVGIQAEGEGARSVLVVDLAVMRSDTGDWLMPNFTALKPATVRTIVREALAAGWNPQGPDGMTLRHPLIANSA